MNENYDFLPNKLRYNLMPFQKEGIKYAISKNGRCLIGDEMGLGKTIQAISVAYYYKNEWPLLIVVPSSLRYPWIEEVERWIPEINPHDINLIQGGADIGGIADSRITVVTYGLLRHPASKIVREALYSQRFKVIVADESHYLKNRKSATTKYLVPLIQKAERKLLLTGTPALARPEELFPQLSALLPKEFAAFGPFAKKYCNAHNQFFGKIKKWVTDGASNLPELQNLLTTKIMIRRLKKDVLTQLPSKQRQRIPFDIKESDLKKDLDSTWTDFHSVLDHNKTPMANVLEKTSSDVPQGSVWFEIRKNMSKLYHQTCYVKLGPVKDYVKMLCENRGLKFLLFAYHHVMMDSIADQLHDDHIKYIRIDGGTLQQDRPRLVHQFQVDKDTRVAILSIKAAGVGLTLTSANLVVFAELDWTPGAMEQCEDRAHRIGQKDTVHIHYLVAKGTLDDWVWAALARKTSVVTTTLNGKTQVLKMDEGNKGQIDCLANADAYKPPENSHENITDFFKSQQAKDQRTMLDFFTPKGVKKKKKTCNKITGLIEPIEIEDCDQNANTSLAEFRTPQDTKTKSSNGSFAVNISTDEHASPWHEVTASKIARSKFHSKEDTITKQSQNIENDAIRSINNDDVDDDCSENSEPINMISHHDISSSSSTESLHIETVEVENSDGICDIDPVISLGQDSLCTDVNSFVDAESTSKYSDTFCIVKKELEISNKSLNNNGGEKEKNNSYTSETWSCSACTFINHTDMPYCEVCTTPKPRGKRKNNQKLDCSLLQTTKNGKRDNRCITKQKTPKVCRQLLSPTTPPVECQANSKKKKIETPSASHKNSWVEKDTSITEVRSRNTNREDESSLTKYVKNNSDLSFTPQINKSEISEKKQVVTNYESKAELLNSYTNMSNRININNDYNNSINDSKTLKNDDFEKLVLKNDVLYSQESDSRSEKEENINSSEDELPDICIPKRLKNKNNESISQISGLSSPHNIPKSIPMNENLSQSPNVLTTPKVEGETNIGETQTPNSDQNNSNSKFKNNSLHNNVTFSFNSHSSVSDEPVYQSQETCPENELQNTPISEKFHTFSQDNGLLSILTPVKSPLSSQESHLIGTPNSSTAKTEEDIIAEETMAAKLLFSPSRKKSDKDDIYSSGQWVCAHCDMLNEEGLEDCDGCLASRPTEKELKATRHAVHATERKVDLDMVPVHCIFNYCCSKNTSRIYLHDQECKPLYVNFVPLDVEVGNYSELPDILLHPENLKLAERFVREWNSLSATKRRVLIKSGQIFTSPCLAYEEVRSKPKHSAGKISLRLLTKEAVKVEAHQKAEEIGGSVRLITRPTISPRKKRKRMTKEDENNSVPCDIGPCNNMEGKTETDDITQPKADITIMEKLHVVAQVLNSTGNPLCLQCHNPYENVLLSKKTIIDNPWQTRFCSRDCMHAYWVRSSREFGVDQVFSEEHGVCQICGFESHEFFLRIKNTTDLKKRAQIIKSSKYNVLCSSAKEKMVKKPTKGLFWEVDHITPVSLGGGQCDIDNLRTLCTPCHREVTSQQNTDRAKRRRLEKAAGCGDITAFFKAN